MSTTSNLTTGTGQYVRVRVFNLLSNGKWETTVDQQVASGVSTIEHVTRTTPINRPKPSGWLYPLAYDRESYSIQRAHGSWQSGRRYKGDNPSGQLDQYSENSGLIYASDSPATAEKFAVPDTFDYGPLVAKAELQALLALKDEKWNAGVALGESSQLAKHVGHTATRIAKAYSNLRKGRWKKAARHLGLRIKDQPGNWLELQYGWKPLLQDVYGASLALSERNEVSDWLATVKASASQSSTIISDFRTTGRLAWWLRSRTDQYRAFVRLDYHPSSFDYLHIPAALGMTNPLSVAWELVPFSFVVDWFSPVGDWLSALDSTLGFSFLSGSVSKVHRRTGKYAGVPTNRYYVVDNGRRVYNGSNALSERLNQVVMSRRVYSSSPTPRPRWKNPASFGHMANGLGLLYQVGKLGRFA